MEKDHLKGEVKNYWEQEPCGSGVAQSLKYTKEYFDEIEEHRYRVEPFIHRFAQFTRYRGKKVLEVGVGAGTDHLQFARAGALLSGIDLTEAAVTMVTKRLALEGLTSDLRRADAEHLPFEDGSFDLVYSWGVIHHSHNTNAIIDEIYRVLVPQGVAKIMVYHKNSMSYYVHSGLIEGILKGKLLKMSLYEINKRHIDGAFAAHYTSREAKRMFVRFSEVSTCAFDASKEAIIPFFGKYARRAAPKLMSRVDAWMLR